MAQYNDIVKLWQGFAIQTASDLDMRLDNFRILFAYHSGKIENDEITYHDTREIFENGKVLNFTGSPRSILEQQNQKLCYDFLLDKLVAKEPLSVALLERFSGDYAKAKPCFGGARRRAGAAGAGTKAAHQRRHAAGRGHRRRHGAAAVRYGAGRLRAAADLRGYRHVRALCACC